MYYVTKRLSDASICHRLGNGYRHKCAHQHGHNYSFEVTIRGEQLDKYGMVIDFGDIKKYLDTWIQDNWDHATIVAEDDKPLMTFLQETAQRMYSVSAGNNTTAEWMSKFLFIKFSQIIEKKVGEHIKVCETKVWETKDSYATYKGQ